MSGLDLYRHAGVGDLGGQQALFTEGREDAYGRSPVAQQPEGIDCGLVGEPGGGESGLHELPAGVEAPTPR